MKHILIYAILVVTTVGIIFGMQMSHNNQILQYQDTIEKQQQQIDDLQRQKASYVALENSLLSSLQSDIDSLTIENALLWHSYQLLENWYVLNTDMYIAEMDDLNSQIQMFKSESNY